MTKLSFLQNDFPKLIQTLNPEAKGEWGVLNGQQMIEHMSDSVRIATGKEVVKILTPEDRLEKVKEFMMSDKEFKQNTKNGLMPEAPLPARNKNVQDAVLEFNNEVKAFINYFETNKGAALPNPFFGNLNFEEWTHLFHKHATHHAKQFKLM